MYITNNKRRNRSNSKERLRNKEYLSPNVFRELKAKKSRYGFTSLMYDPDHIIDIGNSLAIIKVIDPMMTDTVVQYNRHAFEKNRIYIYTNNDAVADYLRNTPKSLKNTAWKYHLCQIS